MAGKRAEAPPSEPGERGRRGDSVAGRGEGGCGPAGERIGPVTISRLIKADGRALILYSRASDER